MVQIFSRNRFIYTDKLSNDLFKAIAINIDTVHEMKVEVTMDLQEKTIVEAEAQITRAPYWFCEAATSKVKDLAGFRLDRKGITKQVQLTINDGQGCTHLVDLVLECIKAFKMTESLIDNLEDSELVRKYHEVFKGTCFAHSCDVEEKIANRIANTVIHSW